LQIGIKTMAPRGIYKYEYIVCLCRRLQTKWIYAYKMPKTLEPWFLSVIDQFFFHMTEKNVKTIHPLCFFELSKISKNEKINRHLAHSHKYCKVSAKTAWHLYNFDNKPALTLKVLITSGFIYLLCEDWNMRNVDNSNIALCFTKHLQEVKF